MLNFPRAISRICLLSMIVVLLNACSASSAGLNTFQSNDGRYGFLYPTGWIRVEVNGGPKVVFHDLINSDETLSLVISKLDENSGLENVGTPREVGERLLDGVIAPGGSGRDAVLIDAQSRDYQGHIYYDIEYTLDLRNKVRHELTTVAVDRGRLYTLAMGTSEDRWPRVKVLFEKVISSFTFLI